MPALSTARAQLLDGVDLRRAHADDHVARLHAGLGRRAAGASRRRGPTWPPSFFSSGVSGRTATPSLPLASASSSAFATLPSSSVPTVAVELDRLAVAPHFDVELRAGRRVADAARDVGAVDHRDAVDLADHVAGLEAGLLRRAVLLDLADERAVRVGQAEALRERLVERLDADAEAAVLHLAVSSSAGRRPSPRRPPESRTTGPCSRPSGCRSAS